MKKISLASLKLFWEKEILCSWSSLIFVWAYERQHMKISPKVIDIQEQKYMSWRSLEKINLILSNSFEIWWCDMWVMLMSNYALVGILVLRFVIPYACTKVNNDAMKIISYLWCIIRCYLCLMLGYEIFCFLVGCFSIFLLASTCTK